MKLSKILKFAGALIGLTGVSLGATFFATQEPLSEKVKDRVVSASEKGFSKGNVGYLISYNFVQKNSGNKPLSNTFKNLWEELDKKDQTSYKEEERSQRMFEVCTSAYRTTLSAFYKGKDLIKDIENFCYLKIQDTTSFNNFFQSSSEEIKSEEKDSLKERMKKADKNDPNADATLKSKGDSGKDGSEDETKQKEFAAWCQELYNKPFISKENKTYKLVMTYCLKTENK